MVIKDMEKNIIMMGVVAGAVGLAAAGFNIVPTML